jgi:hypothetical protein
MEILNMFETYDPLKKEEIAQFRAFQKRFIADPGQVLIFSGEGRNLLVVPHGKQGPTIGELIWGKYNLLYTVDITEHILKFQCQLPCATDAFFFDADVSFSCSVNAPEIIVRREVRDVRACLEPLIIEVMRGQSRSYAVNESGIAEANLSDAIKSTIYDAGFNVSSLVLKLSLSKDAAEYIRNLEQINREKELTNARQDLERSKQEFERQQRIEEEKLAVDRQRQQIQLDLDIKKQTKDVDIEIRTKDAKLSLQEQKEQRELDFELKQKESDLVRQDRKSDADTDQRIALEKIRQEEFLSMERDKYAFEREKLQLEIDHMKLQKANEILKLQQSLAMVRTDLGG